MIEIQINKENYLQANEDSYSNSFIEDDEVIQEIESFLELQEGWNFGRGKVPSIFIINSAKEVYSFCRSRGWDCEAYLNEDGTVSILAILGIHSLDIKVSESDYVLLRYEIGRGSNYKVIYDHEQKSYKDLSAVLFEIEFKCQAAFLSEPSNLRAILKELEDSGTKTSSSLMEVEFQYS
jgi:hypothetical protein